MSVDASAAVIVTSGITKTYGTREVKVEALKGVGLTVDSGEFVAVMGPSGSGKTTLLGILGCLDRPSSGSYLLDGIETAALDETRRARVRRERIGFVFQAYNLLPRSTAFKNVELPLVYAGVSRAERRARVHDALDEVGLAGRSEHRPAELSGGEQQRVAIARALVIRPTVLLADEPTGNLDSENAEEVLALLGRLHLQGATIVMVTHSDEVAARASRIVRLADGMIVADERVDAPVAVGAAG